MNRSTVGGSPGERGFPVAELIVALDFPGRAAALELVDRLGPDAPFYKIGVELFGREGPEMVRELTRRERGVFLDLKLHDIPNTVAGAARAAADLGADLLTVHASGGPRMVAAASRALEGSGTRLLAVTVLTSLTAEELALSWGREPLVPRVEVVRLGELAVENGAHGVVASAREAALLRERLGPEVVIVTPGIRLPGDDEADQARVATPGDAVAAGADFLVVGRTIRDAPDPAAAVGRVRAAMGAGASAAREGKG